MKFGRKLVILEKIWLRGRDSFQEQLRNKEIAARRTESDTIMLQRKLREFEVLKTHWLDAKYNSTIHGTHLLNSILGDNAFDYPKSLHLIKDILKITSPKDAVILDFFAGSGTTGHAVIQLNKEDGGSRRFILCTNNENQIAEEVTYPRMKKVIEGYHEHGDENKKFIKGLPANLRYLKTRLINLDQLDSVSDAKKIEFSHQAGYIIALKEDTFIEVESSDYYQIFKNK